MVRMFNANENAIVFLRVYFCLPHRDKPVLAVVKLKTTNVLSQTHGTAKSFASRLASEKKSHKSKTRKRFAESGYHGCNLGAKCQPRCEHIKLVNLLLTYTRGPYSLTDTLFFYLVF